MKPRYIVTQNGKKTPFQQYTQAYAYWRSIYWKTVGGFPQLTEVGARA